MLPPIYKSANGLPIERRGSGIGSGFFSDSSRKQVAGAGLTSPSRGGYPEPQSNGHVLVGSSSPVLDQMAERMHALERENERFREEIQHLRHFYSSNQQQHESDQLSVGKIADDLQRLANSFNSKLQTDTSYQQREQQKSALLFAELSRLGHRVEGLESELRGVIDDTQRKFEAQDKHAQFLASVGSKQQQAVSPSRTADLHRKVRDMQDAMVQLRSELDADRSARWKTEAAVDAKLDAEIDRLNTKLTADKRDLVRVLDEQRQLVTGADFQRVTAHMRDFSRVNDHLLALERWLHSEFGQIKRIFQALVGDVDSRFQCVLAELAGGLKLWHAAQQRQEEDSCVRFQDLEEATRTFAHAVQRKLRTLEEVIPLEVQARQKNDDKLRRRVEGVVKALGHAIETSRGEYIPQQATLTDRVHQLELAQRNTSDEVSLQHNAMRETIQAFMEDSDAMLLRLAAAVEQERVKGVEIVSAREAALELQPTQTSDELKQEASQVREDLSALQTWLANHEQECRLQSPVASAMTPAGATLDAVTIPIEVIEDSERIKEGLSSLQAWTAMHAQECRQFFDFLNWSVDDCRRESAVMQCLDAVIDQIVETQTCGHLRSLTKGVNGALRQVTAVRAVVGSAPPPIEAPCPVLREMEIHPARFLLQSPTQQHLERVDSSPNSLTTEDVTDMLDLSTTTYYASVNSDRGSRMDQLSNIARGNADTVGDNLLPAKIVVEFQNIANDARQGAAETPMSTLTPLSREEAGLDGTASAGAHEDVVGPLISANGGEHAGPSSANSPPASCSEFYAAGADSHRFIDEEEEYSMDVSQDDDVGPGQPAISHSNLPVHQEEPPNEVADSMNERGQPAQIPDGDTVEPLVLDL